MIANDFEVMADLGLLSVLNNCVKIEVIRLHCLRINRLNIICLVLMFQCLIEWVNIIS